MAEESSTNLEKHNSENVLFEFLKNIHYKTLFQQNDEQIKHLETGVKEIIKEINDVFLADSPFAFEEIIHVGSSYEGSKIISPNEFDFMLVLKTLSQPEYLHIDQGCQPGMKLLRYKTFSRCESSGPNLVFNNILGFKLNSEMKDSDEKREKLKNIRIQTSTAELRVKDIFRYTLHLEYISSDETFDIHIDLMPSVRIPCDTKEILRDLASCPEDIRDIAFRDGCFLVGKFCIIDGMCWKLSFAATERNMMRSLAPGHMKIYRVLKYLFVEKSIVGICDLMSSYVLKTAVLRHAYFDCDEKQCPTVCFVTILQSLSESMGSAFMKSLFVPSLNIWQRTIHEKMRNITENDTVCNRTVKLQLFASIEKEESGLKNALIIAVIFEFWKRIFLLLAAIFDSAYEGSLEKDSMKHALCIVYHKLNEEDEEDDIDADYFKHENRDDEKLATTNNWQIFRSFTNAGNEKDIVTKTCASSLEKDLPGQMMRNEVNDLVCSKIDESGSDEDIESHDLKDIEAFVTNYIKGTDEEFSSDDESVTESSESSGEDFEDSEDDIFVQAEQEDVYEMCIKHKDAISIVNIPVFSELIETLLNVTSGKFSESIMDKFSHCITVFDLDDTARSIKRQKVSGD